MQGSLKRTHRLSKSEKQNRREKAIAFIILLIVSIIWIFPFLYLIGTSFKDEYSLASGNPTIFPEWGHWTFEHYLGFIDSSNHGRVDNLPIWMANSLVSTTLTVLFTLIVDTLAAYAFTFFKFKGKKAILAILFFSMAIPGVIGTTPMYSMYVAIGKATGLNEVALFTLHGTENGIDVVEKIYLYPFLWLILPGIAGVFNLILMKNFFDSIPPDIIDSARSDGAGDFKIFWKIVLPLARSTVLLIVLFVFVGSWNDLIWPQLIVSSNELNYTINVALAGYTGGAGTFTAKAAQCAAAVFALLPILILFIFVQNKMIDGLASTGVKR